MNQDRLLVAASATVLLTLLGTSSHALPAQRSAEQKEADKLAKEASGGGGKKHVEALLALQKLGPPGAEGLVQGLKNKSVAARAMTFLVLADMGAAARDVLPALVGEVRKRAKKRYVCAAEAVVEQVSASMILKARVNGASGAKISELGRIEHEEPWPYEDNIERLCAISALSKIGMHDLDRLMDLVSDDELDPVTAGFDDLRAAFGLAAYRAEGRSRAAVERGLSSDRPQLQATSLVACAMSTVIWDLAPKVVPFLDSTSPQMRALAVDALAQMGRSGGDLGARFVALTQDDSSLVRVQAARAILIRGQGGDAWLPVLVAALGDKDVVVRLAAAQELAVASMPRPRYITLPGPVGLHPPEAVPGLTKLLFDTEQPVRLATARALGNFGPVAKSALDELQRASRDNDPAVNREAGKAAKKVQGK